MAKILLVEDDIELAERLEDWFTLENHTLEVVNSGEDAIQMLESFEFDVIVLDLSDPLGKPHVAIVLLYMVVCF